MSTHVQFGVRLQRFWPVAARLVWVAAFLLAVGLWAIGSLERAGELPPSCAIVDCDPFELSVEDLGVLKALGFPLNPILSFWTLTNTGFALVFFAIAAVIFWRASDVWTGLLASYTLVYLGAVIFTGSDDALWRARPELRRLLAMVYALGYSALMLFFFLFPDGKFVPRSRRLRAVAMLLILVIAPFILDAPRAEPLAVALFLGSVGLGVAAQTHRYRRVSGPSERLQTRWVLFGLMGALMVMLVWVFTRVYLPPDQSSPERIYALLLIRPLIILLIPLLPLTVAFSILRYRLFDIDLVLNRTLVYGTLTVSTMGLYVFIVGYLGSLFQARDRSLIAFLATGLVALLFQPLRERLQRAVNRLMYGERDEPYTVLSRLGRRLEMALTPTAGLQTIVETVARALKLPHVAIALKKGDRFETAASFGLPAGDPLILPLTHQEKIIGQLICTPRAPNEGFTEAEQGLLRNVAHQAGPIAHAVGLTADLQRSRQRLVAAREEERRRIRRDLHDGLGPRLASLTLKLDAARNLLSHDPDATDALLVALKAETQAAIADIRRLVYALRPPALDELGLVGALREHAASHSTPDGLRIIVEAPEELPPLPAAVEVAAFRIALEALTNVERHARARECTVRLALDGRLQLEITDDGVGLPPEYQAGVGLTSMRERAAELGGTCVVEVRPGGGTRVWAELPVNSIA